MENRKNPAKRGGSPVDFKSVKLVYRLEPNGGFIVGCFDPQWAAYAYPSSPAAIRAKKNPGAVAKAIAAADMRLDLVLLKTNQNARENVQRLLRRLL